jgi:dTDP-4-dehydrorhamnose reductase
MVYDGFQPPYLESAAAVCSPINVYGATKLSCESQVTQLRRGVVLRLSNMIGPSFVYKAFGGDKFLRWLFKAFQMRSFVGLKDREVRSFVWVQDVVALINTIAEMFIKAPAPVAVETPVLNLNARDGLDESALDVVLRSSGKIYNVGGPLPLSRLSLAARMSSLLGVDLHVISASDTSNELHHSNSSTWKVHIMNSPLRPSDVTAVVTAGGVASFTHLHSPLDITMDSTSTEKAFSFRFTDLNEALLQCCHL